MEPNKTADPLSHHFDNQQCHSTNGDTRFCCYTSQSCHLLQIVARWKLSEGTAVRLKTYSGQELEVVGRAVVRVRCGGQVVGDLRLVVVGCGGPSLLGPDWLGRLRVDWRGVHELRSSAGTLESLLAKYVNLFGNELDTINGVTAKALLQSPATIAPAPFPTHSGRQWTKRWRSWSGRGS